MQDQTWTNRLAYIKATVTFAIYEVQWAFQDLFFILNDVAIRCRKYVFYYEP